MKLIIAIIQPHHLDSVKNALSQVEVFRLTIMDCQGFGRQQGRGPMVGTDELTVNLRRKIQLQIAVNEELTPSSKAGEPTQKVRSATVRYSCCNSTIAFASAPANAAQTQFNIARVGGIGCFLSLTQMAS